MSSKTGAYDESMVLPVHCERTATTASGQPLYPSSRTGRNSVRYTLTSEYQYNAWLPWVMRSPGGRSPVDDGLVPDVYPLPGSDLATTRGRYTSTDAGSSWSAITALVVSGVLVRIAVYASLRWLDSNKRR